MLCSAAHCERYGQVDLLSNTSNISLPEEARQADLGAVYREKNNWMVQECVLGNAALLWLYLDTELGHDKKRGSFVEQGLK